MADLITPTPTPVKVTAAGKMNLFDAIDVAAYDMLDLQLLLVAATGTISSGSLQIKIITGMQRQVEDNSWLVTPTNFDDLSSLPSLPKSYLKTLNMGFLKYIRWSVEQWPASGLTDITFLIRGIARSYR